ncbi:hypothetical protein ACHAXN_000502 [Cyclotella atomus]
MGRSQVQWNKTHGRPGQTGRGRGPAGRDDRSSRKRQDLSKLGDNSYRFENKPTNALDAADDYDGLLDAIHLSSYIEPDDLLDDSVKEQRQDYLSIDVADMAKCFDHLPMAARLNIPLHVGRHLEELYGGIRKKTLAELREDAMVKSVAVGEVKVLGASSSAKEANADKDEDDLEAWLDDIIS